MKREGKRKGNEDPHGLPDANFIYIYTTLTDLRLPDFGTDSEDDVFFIGVKDGYASCHNGYIVAMHGFLNRNTSDYGIGFYRAPSLGRDD